MKLMKKQNQLRGFTLIELLVVIGLIAILSVVVLLTLNPAELLRQARDSNRISDLATLRSSLALYLSDVSSANLASTTAATPYNRVFISQATTAVPTLSWGVTAAQFTTSTATTSRNVDSSGWVPVGFTSISSGAPIGALPVDPLNTSNSFYGYVATSSNLTFKLTARVESTKYGLNGGSDVVSTDGGISSTTLEVGTNLNL